MRATNRTNDTIDFVVSGGSVKDGVPETCSLAAGETATISVDPDSPMFRAYVLSGAIEVGGSEYKKVVASLPEDPTAVPESMLSGEPDEAGIVHPRRRGGRPRKS